MRKAILVLAVAALASAVGGALNLTRAQQPEPLVIQVDGGPVVLERGENVAPEFYDLARTNADWLATVAWVLIDGKWEPLAKGVTIRLDAQQVILPDGHPDFPADTGWLVADGEEGAIEVPVPLDVPASWAGRYEARVDGNVVYYTYAVNPDQKETIFAIAALTDAQWDEAQDEPHGQQLLAYGGIVWVYNPALDNLYSGDQADEFSRMVGEAYGLVQSLAPYFAPVINAETALPVLQAYFDALGAGNHGEAALMYGGDLNMLADHNPALPWRMVPLCSRGPVRSTGSSAACR